MSKRGTTNDNYYFKTYHNIVTLIGVNVNMSVYMHIGHGHGHGHGHGKAQGHRAKTNDEKASTSKRHK